MAGIERRALRRIRTGIAAVFAAALLVVACDDDPSDLDPANAWEADLTGTGAYADVVGIAAVLSNSTAFAAEIEIEDAPANAVFGWSIVAGTCSEPGDAVGSASDYDDLEVDANGDGTAEAGGDVSMGADDDYAVIVTDDSGSAPMTVVCGALERI